jgi:hypothetical protein
MPNWRTTQPREFPAGSALRLPGFLRVKDLKKYIKSSMSMLNQTSRKVCSGVQLAASKKPV